MLEIFQYNFMIRGFTAGIIIAIIAPLIGIFLVLRRYSLIADTLSHVSLAGVALGLFLGINPIVTAVVASGLSSIGIEKLRLTKRVHSESALAIFLSASLAFAVILISLADGFNVDLFSYLFGSIVTVSQSDVYTVAIVGIFVFTMMMIFLKELTFVTFDEESAKISGINTKFINNLLILLSSLTIAISMPIVGVLLISALIVIPSVSAIQFRKSFKITILIAEVISIFSVFAGIFLSYYLNLATGATIVLVNFVVFVGVVLWKRK